MRLHAEDYKAAPAELVYQFYKRLLKEWELQLADRTRAEASSADGQAATRLFEQTAGFMKPLLDKCKYNVLDETILGHVLQMVLLQLERRYRDAGSHYMSLSIGHAPWPVGVGSFGIHERASRTKIRADNISRESRRAQRGGGGGSRPARSSLAAVPTAAARSRRLSKRQLLPEPAPCVVGPSLFCSPCSPPLAPRRSAQTS